jgi:hypothetical protein
VRIINNHLVFEPQAPGQLKALFPDIKLAIADGCRYCALPHTLDVARVLNNIGIQAPSPIRTQYDWPDAGGRYVPRWYQLDTAEFLTLNPRAHCHNQPRTGKSLASLWAADFLRQREKIHRTLIVAPLSTLWDVWEQTIFETFPLRTFAVLHGDRKKRLALLDESKDFYIVNHHGVGIIEDALSRRPDIDHVIYDEVAVVRNGGKRRKPDAPAGTLYEPADRVVNKQGIQRSIWGLTGTPTPNAPTDAYGQSKLITPWHVKGKSFTSFKQSTMLKLGDFKWVPMRSAHVEVARVLKPSICFDRTVCTDMAPCHIYRRAELSPSQTKAYRAIISKSLANIEGQTITAVHAAALAGKVIQIACGAVLDVDGNIAKMDFGPRLAVLEELIEENQEKVLVFAPFTASLELLAEKLRKRWSVEVINGAVSTGKRNQIFKDFRNAKDPHILVCHPGTMAHGLDLTAASLSIWYAPYWKAEYYQQANARIDGSKQKSKIDIAHIYATAEEHRIYQVLQGKGTWQDVVLSMSNDKW